jgi:ribosomal protein L21E
MLGLTGIITGRQKHKYSVELTDGHRVKVAQSGLARV